MNKETKKTYEGIFAVPELLNDAFLKVGQTIRDALDVTKAAKKTEKTVAATVSGINRALANFDEVDILKMPTVKSGGSTKSTTTDISKLVDIGVEALLSAGEKLFSVKDFLQTLAKIPGMMNGLIGPLERTSGAMRTFGNLFPGMTVNLDRTHAGTQELTKSAQSLSSAWSGVTNAMRLWQQSAIRLADTGDMLQQPLTQTGGEVMTLAQQVLYLSDAFSNVGKSSNAVLSSVREKWGGLGDWFRTYVGNRLIGETNGALGNIVAGINQALCSKGAKSMGLNYAPLPVPKIPYLAKGAVLPANKPFLAVVGDQKHGTNVEAPLETIKKAVAEVVDNTGSDVVINFTGDLAQLARVLRPAIQRENSRVGGKLVTREVM